MNLLNLNQLEGFAGVIDSRQLLPGLRHANASLCRFDGALLMAYRLESAEGRFSVAITRLTRNLRPGKSIPVQVAHEDCEEIEDPRLFVLRDRLHLLAASARYVDPAIPSRQRLFRLDADFQVEAEIPLPFGMNGKKCEKNWSPFETLGGGFGFVHFLSPHRVFAQADAISPFVVHVTPGIPRWRWGTASGRCPPILLRERGQFLNLFGGFEAHPRRYRRYWIAAGLFDAQPPYALTAITPKPICWAHDQTPAFLNAYNPDWNPVCVFPCGAVLDGAELLLSAGINDSYIGLFRFNLEQILQAMIPPAQLTGAETLAAGEGELAAAGQVRVRVVCRQPLGELGGPYHFGQEFFTSLSRVRALGKLVEVVR